MKTTPRPPRIPGLEFVQPLGSGGYADVYLYEQQMPRMNVAVKVLKRDGLTPAIRRQFLGEANTMAQLADHPYIVQVFRSDATSDGGAYLVMKYYPPPNLAVRARKERLSVEEVLRTGIQLASAVETAHRAGIIHRDIKPANVLVSQYGAPGLTDFGIAGRAIQQEEHDEDVGVSVPWSPPEVLYGQSNGDRRSDVYSLAATLWHLLVGRSPFEQPGGDNSAYALMPRIRATPVPPTGRADVPLSLERLLAHAMAKNPDSRPQTALELARGLQAIEQEHRFPRTPIVVLDEEGNTAVADHSESGEDERTVVRAPQAVGAQRTDLPVRAASPPADEGVQTRTISGGALLGGVALVVVALVVALVWALGRNEPAAGGGGPSPGPGPTTVEPTDGGGLAIDVPDTPALDARPVKGGVAFSWGYGNPADGDFARFFVARTRAGVDSAPVEAWKKPSPRVVPARRGTLVCAKVGVARSAGTTSALSPTMCERAG